MRYIRQFKRNVKKINSYVHFEEIIANLLEEKEDKTQEFDLLPWCIEITKDPNKSEEYNELGRIIIKLNEIRAKLH